MTKIEQGLELTPPQSIWKKNLKFDAKPLFTTLSKTILSLVSLDAKETCENLVDAAASIGLDSPEEEIAYKLIETSLLNALTTLTKESSTHITPDESRAKALDTRVQEKLKDVVVDFNKKFFTNPGNSKFLSDIQEAYLLWLERIGASHETAQSISQRLPAYFVYSLAAEWRSNISIYQVLTEQLDSPFAEAENAEKGWRLYYSYLKLRTSESVFDEPFSLSQIYVELNAYYTKKPESSDPLSLKSRFIDQKICIDLMAELKLWLVTGDKSDPMRILSGGPGSGKSSFTKMFCVELSECGVAKPIYIPLHLIDPTRDIVSEVERFVRDEGLLGFNPLDPNRSESKILLVFDGLDELASMGKVAAQVAKDFVNAVERMLERRNLGAHPIFSLISGREVIIQENETEFRKPKQILTILPYWLSEVDKREYRDPNNILDNDLREKWWKTYGTLTGLNYEGLPHELKVSEINDITSQPLLNYLVALSYKRGRLDFNKKLNLNNVYGDLVSAVYERGYEKSRPYGPISHITSRDFIRVLEEVGLAAWHGSDGRSTSVKEIMLHCQQSGLETLLKSFTEGAEAGVTKLLAAFFFRRNGETVGEDAAFVFTHKSFGEYLTATRLVRGLDRVINERKRRKNDPDDGMDIADALTFWLKIAGPAPLTEYLKLFLSREISGLEKQKLETWHEILCELCNHAIEKMMPVERIGNLNFSKSVAYDKNASTSLLISLNSCAIALEKISVLKLSSSVSFGNFLKRVCPQRTGPISPLIYSALSYMDLSGQCLDMADLYGVNLSNSKLNRCSMHFANFGRSNLTAATFTNSTVSYSRFDGSLLNDIDFTSTNLNECIINSHITNACFNEANLQDTDLENTTFSNCSFRNTLISDVKFHSLERVDSCDFDGAIIERRSQYSDEFILWFNEQKTSGSVLGNIKIVEEIDDEEVEDDEEAFSD